MELSKSKLSVYSSLGSAKMRRKHGLFTVEGEKAVRDSVGSYAPEALIILRGENIRFEGIGEDKVYEVLSDVMKKLSNFSTHSSVFGVFRHPGYVSETPSGMSAGFYPVLDGIQDPGNLGTIIRTCHWFGLRTIFASEDTVDLFNPKTVQATMGSHGKVEVIYCDLAELIKANGEMPVYGLMLDGRNIFKATLGERGFIVMGNEGKGISPEVRALVTDPLLIPPGGEDHSESLNVAVATAITVAQFCSRR